MSAPCDEAIVAALAGFDDMTLPRLVSLLRDRSPSEAWAIVEGAAPATGLIERVIAEPRVRAAWQRSARSRVPAEIWDHCRSLGVAVVLRGRPGYPDHLHCDRFAPPVLFARGDLSLLDGRRAAIVGTRNATAAGKEAARRLATGIAAAGVHIVSGLARGIDGIAHRAVIAAEGPGRPIAVVGTGIDVVYPREHRDLWAAVGSCGLLLSESPPGVGPAAYRFPLRNRVIAALSEVVVVVESRERGGSLITAAEALDRGVPVMAVPGPPANRAASGTNSLLRDGAAPAIDADDVLSCLALGPVGIGPRAGEMRPRPRTDDLRVYDALRGEPRTIDSVALACSVSLVDAAMSLARLEHAGWVSSADGWFECVGMPL